MNLFSNIISLLHQFTPLKHKKSTRSFSSTNYRFVDDKSFNQNKEFFDNTKDIKPVNYTPVDKNLSDDKLLSLLEANKQEISDQIYSAAKCSREVDKIFNQAYYVYKRDLGKMSADELDTLDKNLSMNASTINRISQNSSDEDKCLFNIERNQKKLLDAMYRVKSVDKALSSTGDSSATNTKNSVVEDSKQLMQQFNSLSENIINGVNNNNSIRKELRDRDVSLYPEEFFNASSDS